MALVKSMCAVSLRHATACFNFVQEMYHFMALQTKIATLEHK